MIIRPLFLYLYIISRKQVLFIPTTDKISFYNFTVSSFHSCETRVARPSNRCCTYMKHMFHLCETPIYLIIFIFLISKIVNPKEYLHHSTRYFLSSFFFIVKKIKSQKKSGLPIIRKRKNKYLC